MRTFSRKALKNRLRTRIIWSGHRVLHSGGSSAGLLHGLISLAVCLSYFRTGVLYLGAPKTVRKTLYRKSKRLYNEEP
jgi:hypothetical protein